MVERPTDRLALNPHVYRQVDHPNGSKKDGTIHDIALSQLHAYQAYADTTSLWPDGRCHRCMDCDQNIYFGYDEYGVVYNYTDEEIRALKVGHIRICHPEVIDG
jgi:hypothetical protein